MALPQTHWIRMLNPWVIHTFKLLSRCLINLLKVLILNKFHFFTLIENLPPAILKKLQVKWKLLSRVWLFVTPWTIQSMDSPGQNTGVGSLFLLQGIFPTWGLNLGLPHCRQILYQLSHKGSPILKKNCLLFCPLTEHREACSEFLRMIPGHKVYVALLTYKSDAFCLELFIYSSGAYNFIPGLPEHT